MTDNIVQHRILIVNLSILKNNCKKIR